MRRIRQPVVTCILLACGIVMMMPGPRALALAIQDEEQGLQSQITTNDVEIDPEIDGDSSSDEDDEESEFESEDEDSDEEDEDEECLDHHSRCPYWAHLGECDVNPPMLEYCAKSCQVCENDEEEEGPCVDYNKDCRLWAEQGECESNPVFMKDDCRKSCKVCIPLPRRKKSSSHTPNSPEEEMRLLSKAFGKRQDFDGPHAKDVLKQLELSIEYMKSDTVTNLPIDIKRKCRNRDEACTFWSSQGECEKNEHFMKSSCGPACMSCEYLMQDGPEED